MHRSPVRLLLSAAGVVALAVPSAAHAASGRSAGTPHGVPAAASCAGAVQTSVGPTGVRTTGSATCTGLTALRLNTTVTAAGVDSVVSTPLTALPNLPVPIDVTVPAVGATAGCATLVQAGSGATVATSCTGSTTG
ncbi:MAG TPA: hypothetical protein VNV66_09295 [Pilimelia sp.]|nr:hypothetical protein [Pilimelia sp.]